MSKRPYYPIAQLHSKLFENGIIENIQWIDFSIFHEVTNLPAYTPVWFQYPAKLRNQTGLGFQIVTYRCAVFVDFSKIVWRGSDNECDGFIWNLCHKVRHIAIESYDFSFLMKSGFN